MYSSCCHQEVPESSFVKKSKNQEIKITALKKKPNGVEVGGAVVKGACCKSGDPSSISWTHTVTAENRLFEVTPRLTHVDWSMRLHYRHTQA